MYRWPPRGDQKGGSVTGVFRGGEGVQSFFQQFLIESLEYGQQCVSAGDRGEWDLGKGRVGGEVAKEIDQRSSDIWGN